MNIDKEELRLFLIEASKAGYASESTKAADEPDGSHTITYKRGQWKFHDNFFGGEPYGGREVIFYKGNPVWIMVYYGRIEDSSLDPNDVYKFLRKALKNVHSDKPFRGPNELSDGVWLYKNTVEGDIERFHGHEHITKSGRKIYEARYIGGFVDKRRGD